MKIRTHIFEMPGVPIFHQEYVLLILQWSFVSSYFTYKA